MQNVNARIKLWEGHYLRIWSKISKYAGISRREREKNGKPGYNLMFFGGYFIDEIYSNDI